MVGSAAAGRGRAAIAAAAAKAPMAACTIERRVGAARPLVGFSVMVFPRKFDLASTARRPAPFVWGVPSRRRRFARLDSPLQLLFRAGLGSVIRRLPLAM